MSGRKASKRAGDAAHAAPTTERLVELASLAIDPAHQLGPIDQEDMRAALVELIDRRNGQAIATALPERSAA